MEAQIDLLEQEVTLEQASSGKRFANYIIDLIVFYVIVFGLSVLYIIATGTTTIYEEDNVGANLLDRLISLILYGVFMSLVEGITKGRSLGKLITGTKAVNEDGTPISFSTAFARGFSRAVPFNAFSALGNPCYPWHDKWSRTYVVDIKNSTLPA